MEKIPTTYNQELFQEYKAKLKTLLDKFISLDKAGEYMDILAGKGKELRSRYPDVENYAFWHVLSGSTIHDDAMIHTEDFPGEDSVALFIDELANSETLG